MSEQTNTPAVPAVVASTEPDLSNMTGEQAVAYVQAQKNQDAAAKLAKVPQKAVAKPEANPIKEAAQEAKRKLKVGDEEIDEDEVLNVYKSRKEHQRAANKELQEGKAARKQAEEFVKMMRDPQAFFETAKKLGHDPRDLAEKYLVSQLQDELMDPRDKELRDTKAKLKSIEDLERVQKEQQEKAVSETLKAKFAKDYSDQFVAALKDSGLPATKPMVAEMAKYISRSAKLGFKMSAQEASQLVLEDVRAAHTSLIGNTDGEMLLKLLGEGVANKIREADMKKLKNPENILRTPTVQSEHKSERKSGKRMSPQEWRLHRLGKK